MFVDLAGFTALTEAHGDFDAVVMGLDVVPPADRPPVVETRTAFQVMVGAGTAMALVAAAAALVAWRRRRRGGAWPRPLLWALLLASPLGFVALEAGWLVTEWGRQPWVVRGFLRTADAVTSFPYRAAPFWLFTVVYAFLGGVVAFLLARQMLAVHRGIEPEAPDGH